jgi:hypothetical protein
VLILDGTGFIEKGAASSPPLWRPDQTAALARKL